VAYLVDAHYLFDTCAVITYEGIKHHDGYTFGFEWKWKELECFMLLFSQGNRLFKEGKYELAKAKYEKVFIFLFCA